MSSRVQHVSVPRPGGKDADARAVSFYQDILGAKHVPAPQSLSHLDLSWFLWGNDEIHVFAVDPGEALPVQGAHFCMAVDDLEEMRSRLLAAGVECEETDPIPGRPRFFIRDPFGNRVELSHIEE